MRVNLAYLVRRFSPILAVPVSLALAFPACAQSTATVSVNLDSTQLRRAIPSDFLGLSLEMSSIEAANNNGVAWLSGTPSAYSTMVQKIGVQNIRIGGNSAERQPYATAQDGANVDAFANLIGANLIWTVPVKQFYNQSTSVSYVSGLYNDQHVAHNYSFRTNIEVGNEPDNSEDVPGTTVGFSPLGLPLRDAAPSRPTSSMIPPTRAHSNPLSATSPLTTTRPETQQTLAPSAPAMAICSLRPSTPTIRAFTTPLMTMRVILAITYVSKRPIAPMAARTMALPIPTRQLYGRWIISATWPKTPIWKA